MACFYLPGKRPERFEMGRRQLPRGAGDLSTMARIAGVNIPTNKRVIIALTYIHGIGRKTAVDLADKLGIDHARRVQDMSDAEVLQIR